MNSNATANPPAKANISVKLIDEKKIREDEHAHKDEGSAILQHCKKTKHARAKAKNFTVLAANYPHWQRRKICESMFIRDRNPDLNKQGDKHRQSYKLHLFA